MSPQELAFRRGKCFIKSVALSGGLELLHCLHRKLCYYFRKSPLVSRGCLEDHFLSLEVETRSVGTGGGVTGTADPGARKKTHRLHFLFSICSHEPSTGQRYPEEQSQSSMRTSSSPSNHAVFAPQAQHLSELKSRLPWQFLGQLPPAAALKGDFLCEASPGCAVIMRLPWKAY